MPRWLLFLDGKCTRQGVSGGIKGTMGSRKVWRLPQFIVEREGCMCVSVFESDERYVEGLRLEVRESIRKKVV